MFFEQKPSKIHLIASRVLSDHLPFKALCRTYSPLDIVSWSAQCILFGGYHNCRNAPSCHERAVTRACRHLGGSTNGIERHNPGTA
jgi:hypothetical protein